MKKHNILFSIFSIFFLNVGIAQEKTVDFGQISLAVIMPENLDGLSESQLSKIESKLHRIITSNGLSGSGYNNSVVIYPKFEIYNESVVEGMKNIITVEVEFSSFIKQVDNNMMFASYTKSIVGSGYTKEKAINNAISKIPVNEPKQQAFIKKGKAKIIDYYEKNCDNISAKSDAFIQMKKYKQAIALLLSVPEEVSSCYTKIQQKSIDAYLAYQKQYCQELLQLAKSAYSANDYSQALQHLSIIDPSSTCNNNALEMMAEIKKLVVENDKKEWDFMMKKYSDSVVLEKSRIEAMKEVAKAYYKSKPQTVYYNSIVR